MFAANFQGYEMKILHVGKFFYGRAPVLRAESLKELGNDIVKFDISNYEGFCGRYINWAFRKLQIPNPGAFLMNRYLIKTAVKIMPDVVWINKGMQISSRTLKAIRSSTRAFLLSETADNMLISGNKTKEFISSIPEYDLMVTDKNVETVNYYDYGAKNVYSIHKGFFPEIHKPIELTEEEQKIYGADVVFCGGAEHDRAESLSYLIQHDINVKIWGNLRSWKKMKCFPTLSPFHSKTAVWWAEYAKAINGAKIAICFLRHVANDSQTQRTFELPACQTMTIAERTEDHMHLFKEDKEMVFFSNNDELLDKVKYYLKHDKAREEIAKAGRLKCVNSDYTYSRRYRNILNKIAELDL
jgi:hypothetical protein